MFTRMRWTQGRLAATSPHGMTSYTAYVTTQENSKHARSDTKKSQHGTTKSNGTHMGTWLSSARMALFNVTLYFSRKSMGQSALMSSRGLHIPTIDMITRGLTKKPVKDGTNIFYRRITLKYRIRHFPKAGIQKPERKLKKLWCLP